jgi:hypothetical protein
MNKTLTIRLGIVTLLAALVGFSLYQYRKASVDRATLSDSPRASSKHLPRLAAPSVREQVSPKTTTSNYPQVALKKPVFVQTASPKGKALEATLAQFIREEALTREETDRFLTALYDAQENLQPTPKLSEHADENELRKAVYTEFTQDLFATFDPGKLERIFSRWNVFAMVSAAAESRPLRLE